MSSFEAADLHAVPEFVPDPIGHGANGFRPDQPSPLDARSSDSSPSEDAEADLAAAHQAAVTAAYERGLEEGRAAAEARLARPIEALGSAARALETQRDRYLDAQRTLLVDLGLSIAERIVEHEIETDRTLLAIWVDRALDMLDPDSQFVVRISEADHAELTAGRHPELEELAGDAAVRLAADSDLDLGEARVVSGGTTIEIALSKMLARFREALVSLEPGETAEPDEAAENDGSAPTDSDVEADAS